MCVWRLQKFSVDIRLRNDHKKCPSVEIQTAVFLMDKECHSAQYPNDMVLLKLTPVVAISDKVYTMLTGTHYIEVIFKLK
jgi:hypothetical protein